ncbi:MAG: sugar phosphate isomerase/epimerase [Clostridia bacterium]|nr:sugar phosphate isomerase/epimerase [Clostridia bacterium]
MLLGIPSLMEFSQNEDLFRFCAENGFAFAEMNMTFPWFQAGEVDVQRLRALQKEYGIGLTIHFHDRLDPFEFSPEMRKGSLENAEFAMNMAREVQAMCLNMHLMPGTYSSINSKKTYLYEKCSERYMELVQGFVKFAEEKLAGTDTLVCVENTSGFLPFQKRAIEELLKSPRFALTFDIGHSFKAGGEDEKFILAHADRLRHFHIHDCSLKANHLALGDGGLDTLRYLKMAEEKDCTAVIEVKESSALLHSRDYLIANGMW